MSFKCLLYILAMFCSFLLSLFFWASGKLNGPICLSVALPLACCPVFTINTNPALKQEQVMAT